jgi:hypothetical protein
MRYFPSLMRASTAWLLATALVLLAALATYNLALRDEYWRRLRTHGPDEYVQHKFADFNEIVLPDSASLGVRIEQGPFQVRVRAAYDSLVHVRQQGRQLFITVDSTDALDDSDMLLITCPRLARVSTRPVAGPATASRDVLGRCNVVVEGFQSDSLFISQAKQSRFVLNSNKLKFLQATVGTGPASYAALELYGDNRIEAARLVVNGTSELFIYELLIPKLRYEYSDSAVIQLPGRMVPRQPRVGMNK